MKALIIGDNLITSEMMLSRCDPLREAGFKIEALNWLAADRNALTQRNLNVERNGPQAEPLPEGALEAVMDATVLLTHFCPVPRSLLQAGNKLKAIGLARAGWENIDLAAATEYGVPVIHIVGRNANAVAEHTVGLILCEMRNMARSHAAMMAGTWYNRMVDPALTYELAGKTIGLIGFGAIGRLVARRLSGFEPRLLVYDPFLTPALIEESGGEAVSLETLLRQSDVVSLHARLLPETEGLIGWDELALMKPTAYLINTARAGLINEEALVDALQRGTLAGAALDVFWHEPLPADSPLLRMKNVTLNSHIAGTTVDSLRLSVDLTVKALLDYLHHDKKDWIINQEVFDNGKDEF
jgi:D-3-phosphoglycerate dehydrogenase